MYILKHFRTVAKHRRAVRKGCFAVGLYRQGLTHDLSKYSPSEFGAGIRYYQGTRSPNSRERELFGYSKAWMHHKGRNKHHFEYWTDLNPKTRRYEPVPMPRRYLAEMVMDRIAACKTYHGRDYKDGDALEYLEHSQEARESSMMHPQTKRELVFLLTMLRDQGEKETYHFIREVVLKNKPFAEE